jgi:hypothetical protein
VKYRTNKTHGFPKLGDSRKETLVPAQPSNLCSPECDATAYRRLSDPQFSWGQKVVKRLTLRGDDELRASRLHWFMRQCQALTRALKSPQKLGLKPAYPPTQSPALDLPPLRTAKRTKRGRRKLT